MNCRVGIYARISQIDEQCKDGSINNQIAICRNYCDKNNFTVIEEYVDINYTGANFNRPGFKRMMEDVYLNKIDVIIFKDLSRLGRNYLLTAEIIDKLINDNIRIISINDNYDSLNSDGELSLAFKNYINTLYLKDCKRKSRNATERSVRNGTFVKGIYGYKKVDKCRFEIDPYSASIVTEIFERALKGEAILDITDDLNRRKILVPEDYKNSQMGKPIKNLIWKGNNVYNILYNIQYTGKNIRMRYSRIGRESYILDDFYPQIISKDMFDNVKALLKKRNNNITKKVFKDNFSQILYYKGNKLSLRENWLKKLYYANKNGMIPQQLINESILNACYTIIEDVANKLNEDEFFNKHFKFEELESTISMLKKDIDLIKDKSDLLVCDYIEEKITLEEYKAKMETYNIECEKLESLLREKNNEYSKIKAKRYELKIYLDNIRNIDMDDKTKLVLTCIKRCDIERDDSNIKLKIQLF